MFADCFEDSESSHTAPRIDATGQSPIFASLGEVIAEIQAGRMIVVVEGKDGVASD